MKTMKIYLLLVVFFASHLLAFGELTKDELDRFESNVKIAEVRTDSWKSDDREKYEVLEVSTFQSQDDPQQYDMSRFQIRLVVELTDNQKNTYLVKFTGNAPEDYNSDYKGEDYWRLYMAHGDLGRFKITGYAIQYGFMDDENFVPLAAEEDDSEKMLERARAQTTCLFSEKLHLWHYYIYDDSSEGDTESPEVNIRLVKE